MSKQELVSLIKNAKRSSFPKNISPMLATLVDAPFDEPGWLYEVKWDGYRAISYLGSGDADIRSRNNKSFNEKFYPVLDALRKWKISVVVDGEIIAINEKGISDFEQLQTWRSEADGQLVYYLFDVLWINGYSVMQLPLAQRKKILRSIVPQSKNVILLSESFETGATEFFKVAEKLGLEGIIAKKASSIYIPGFRSKDWLKIKIEKRQEMVIGGYTKNENTSRQFSALLMGVFEENEFQFVTPVGTGFSDQLQTELLKKFKALKTKVCPFSTIPEYNKPSRFRPHPPKAAVTWLKPELIAEIRFAEETRDGAIRHPVFIALREDKDAREVTREREQAAEEIIEPQKIPENLFTKSGKAERKSLLNPKDEVQVRTIQGSDIKFANLSKIYFPKKKVAKRDVINYYYQIAPLMLPFMKDRPQTLIRYPNGIEGESFYQKDVTDKAPEWIKKFPYYSEKDKQQKNYLVCTNEASLLYIASIGGIEMHPWSSRVHKPDHPDWCIIDLDPDKNTFEQVIKAAQVTKEVLDAIDVSSFCKTSGSTGLHIYIPLGAKYSYEDSREFGRALVKIIHEQTLSFTSIERIIANREGKMYLDFLQNRPQATLAAPYSLRPKPDATVSMPLPWSEVKKGLKMKDFTIFNAVAIARERGNIFAGVLGKGIDMKRALKKMQSVFQAK